MNAENAPFRLALLRHADAEWPMPGERDYDRRLSLHGRSEALTAGNFLKTTGFHPEAIITSPALRCVETLAIVKDAFPAQMDTHKHSSLYNSSSDEYLSTISEYIDCKAILLAGHNPILEELLVQLIGIEAANLAMPHGFQTSAIAIIDIERPVQLGASKAHLVANFIPGSEV